MINNYYCYYYYKVNFHTVIEIQVLQFSGNNATFDEEATLIPFNWGAVNPKNTSVNIIFISMKNLFIPKHAQIA